MALGSKFLLIIILSSLSSFSYGITLTPELLEKKYRNITFFDGSFEQTKTSPIFIRPLTSQVRIIYQNKVMEWFSSDPKRADLRFADGQILLYDAKTKSYLAKLPQGQSQATPLIRTFQALLTFDLKKLGDFFNIVYQDDALTLTPKTPMKITNISLRFDKLQNLTQLDLDLESEKVSMRVIKLQTRS